MPEAATKLPVQKPARSIERAAAPWPPMDLFRRDLSRLSEDFGDLWRSPLRSNLLEPLISRDTGWTPSPAVDVVEKDRAYEISAELPGMDEKNIEVKVANGTLCIKGEKREEKEEKQHNYFLSERRFGSFERRFQIPDGIDGDKIEATFAKGVLTVTLPKSAAAQAAEKKISVKAA